MMRQSKMAQLVNCRLRISLLDGRLVIGQLLAFDRHMNLVVADCEEFRLTRRQQQKHATGAPGAVEPLARRTLGLLVLRGEEVVAVTAEGGPPLRGGNRARLPVAQQQHPALAPMPVPVPAGFPPMPPMPPGGGPFVRPPMPPGQF